MDYYAFPHLTFANVSSQPSDRRKGRQISVLFDSNNLSMDSYGNFNSPLPTVTVYGTDINGVASETFTFSVAGGFGSPNPSLIHFTSLTNISATGNKLDSNDYYGVAEIKESLPISQTNVQDGYVTNVLAYGSGIFVVDGYGTYDAYGNSIGAYGAYDGYDGYGDPSTGTYEFEYLSPLHIPIRFSKKNIVIGNNNELNKPFDGIVDEIKITSATAIKNRNRLLAGSYDISKEAKSPISQEPDAKTLVLMHCDDNAQDIIDAVRNPLDSANLPDSVLQTIVSLRNDKTTFINYVNSLGLSGSLTEQSNDTRSFAEQLHSLVSALNRISNSANYLKVAGKFFPSETTINSNFENAASFVGETYSVSKVGLINDVGTIEVWIAPMFNTLGDLKTRVYFDIFNHAVVGTDGNLTSLSPKIIKLPNNVQAQQIMSVKLFDSAAENDFDFGRDARISSNGNVVVLNTSLPLAHSKVIVDYIPLSSTNDRLTLYKDPGSRIVFALTSGGTTYTLLHDISGWKKDTWHRVMVTWKTNTNSVDNIHMFVDGTESSIIKFGQGFEYGSFVFNQENLTTVTTRLIAQNINLSGKLDTINIGTAFDGSLSAMARMGNLRISYVDRQPIVDSRGNTRDGDYGGGSISASPVVFDSHTTILENFDPKSSYITKFASVPDIYAGIFDADIQIKDEFNLIRGVNDGMVERLVKQLIKIAQPAHIRSKISIVK